MNKPKKLYLPKWFPYPSAWLKALIMISFLTLAIAKVRDFELGIYFGKLGGSLELLVCLSIIILFFLIPVFAFAHHFLILLFYTIREIFSKRYRYNLFFFPAIISWWKALYSWLVIIISTLAAILVSTLILPLVNLNYTVFILEKNRFLYPESVIDKLLLFVFISIWLIVAAKLYQFEFISKKIFLLRQTNYRTQAKKYKINQTNQNPHQINLNNIDDELAKSRINYGVNQITKPQNIRDKVYNTKLINPPNYRLKKLPKLLKENILVLLIIPLLGLGVYGFSQWELVSETPVVVVTEIPSPIPKKVNSEKPEVAEVKTKSTPLSSPAKQSASIPTTTIVLPPPDPFTLAVNRAMNAAKMVQSAQSKIEWEAVASQWQDAAELMKIVPVSHPKYKEARKKIKEYQSYADYAIRVGKIKR
ncbi:hypothetical protein [Dapis sp. BLCC M229]|uniref:hypothetical protein n=1 Tax=Dapis sp. BLCC M229 TaxID=3400188 RepID=UPI003CF6BE55